ncbi:MAG: hypothetical protein AABM32_04780 [Chloroflexota bacterium]
MADEVPRPAAAATDNDALFAAKAALKLAARQRKDADAQFHHLRQLIDRLEKSRHTGRESDRRADPRRPRTLSSVATIRPTR